MPIDYPDELIVCKDCQREFYFTAGEQKFYQEKGFTNSPTRCPQCRTARKLKAQAASLEPNHPEATQPPPDPSGSLDFRPTFQEKGEAKSEGEPILNLAAPTGQVVLTSSSSTTQEVLLLTTLLDRTNTCEEQRSVAALALADLEELTPLAQMGLIVASSDSSWRVSWAAVEALRLAGDEEAAQWLEFKLGRTTGNIDDPQFQFIIGRAIRAIRKQQQADFAFKK